MGGEGFLPLPARSPKITYQVRRNKIRTKILGYNTPTDGVVILQAPVAFSQNVTKGKVLLTLFRHELYFPDVEVGNH